jgi:hypothetical protein
MTKLTEDTELLTDITPEDEEIIGQGEIQFNPTGSKHKDMAIAGMINDAPNACKALIKVKKWDIICASPNPAGQAEIGTLKLYSIPNDLIKPVLIKVKSLLTGRNMSIMQAQHNCILDSVIKRIDLNKLTPLIVKVTNTVTTTKIDIKSELIGSILTSSDGKSYTFGTRGRRPLWVLEWLKINPEPEM